MPMSPPEHPTPITLEPALAAAQRRDHAELAEQLAELRAAIAHATWSEAGARWSELRARVESHLQFEEQRLFPMFEVADARHPKLVLGLRHDHMQLREALEDIAAGIAAEAVGLPAFERVIAALERHAAAEDELFHPFLAGELA
jgi:hypothetical protein